MGKRVDECSVERLGDGTRGMASLGSLEQGRLRESVGCQHGERGCWGQGLAWHHRETDWLFMLYREQFRIQFIFFVFDC